jgi:hypothetical protein
MPIFMNKLSFDTKPIYFSGCPMNLYSFLLLVVNFAKVIWGGGGQEWQEGGEKQIILNVLQCNTIQYICFRKR